MEDLPFVTFGQSGRRSLDSVSLKDDYWVRGTLFSVPNLCRLCWKNNSLMVMEKMLGCPRHRVSISKFVHS